MGTLRWYQWSFVTYCHLQVGTTTWLAHFLNISHLSPKQKAAVNTSKLLHKVPTWTLPSLFGCLRVLCSSHWNPVH